MQLNMMVYVSPHSVVPIIAIQPETRYVPSLFLSIVSRRNTDAKAAYVRMQSDGQLSYHQFDAVPHPAVKPMAYSSGFNFMSGM